MSDFEMSSPGVSNPGFIPDEEEDYGRGEKNVEVTNNNKSELTSKQIALEEEEEEVKGRFKFKL